MIVGMTLCVLGVIITNVPQEWVGGTNERRNSLRSRELEPKWPQGPAFRLCSARRCLCGSVRLPNTRSEPPTVPAGRLEMHCSFFLLCCRARSLLRPSQLTYTKRVGRPTTPAEGSGGSSGTCHQTTPGQQPPRRYVLAGGQSEYNPFVRTQPQHLGLGQANPPSGSCRRSPAPNR